MTFVRALAGFVHRVSIGLNMEMGGNCDCMHAILHSSDVILPCVCNCCRRYSKSCGQIFIVLGTYRSDLLKGIVRCSNTVIWFMLMNAYIICFVNLKKKKFKYGF